MHVCELLKSKAVVLKPLSVWITAINSASTDTLRHSLTHSHAQTNLQTFMNTCNLKNAGLFLTQRWSQRDESNVWIVNLTKAGLF